MDASGEDDPPLTALAGLFDELISSEIVDGSVAVVNDDTGWCISAHHDGRLIMEHLGSGGERHMIPVSKERVLELWRQLVDGDIDGLQKEPWKPGYS
jgi:hypothetical protein